MTPTELAALIPLPVKTSPEGNPLSPWDWQWPRSEAYERAASAVLPAGWTLYSVVDAEHDGAAKDFGARREALQVYVWGLRATDGKPWKLRAFARGAGIRDFAPGDLAAACAWCGEATVSAPELLCATCRKPAACIGSYEGAEHPSLACDDCCGHGSEDGRCYQLNDKDADKQIAAMFAAMWSLS